MSQVPRLWQVISIQRISPHPGPKYLLSQLHKPLWHVPRPEQSFGQRKEQSGPEYGLKQSQIPVVVLHAPFMEQLFKHALWEQSIP
jgi:hypothetical protein